MNKTVALRRPSECGNDELDYGTYPEGHSFGSGALPPSTGFRGPVAVPGDEQESVVVPRMQPGEDLAKHLVGSSRAMMELRRQIFRVAAKPVNVLITGETGTGKEIVSWLLHENSPRRPNPFVRFNCAAIPRDLADAELFGHAKGAFTGALTGRKGFFAQAHGGTLVLDEVETLPLEVQPKLLRALQSGEIQTVGTSTVGRVDVRAIACTNATLPEEVALGRFRQDLFYRLAVVKLVVPPLRERKGDMPLLIDHFMKLYCRRFQISLVRFHPVVIAEMSQMEWPGNVRELENAVGAMLAMCDGDEVGLDLFENVIGHEPREVDCGASGQDVLSDYDSETNIDLRERVADFEKSLIVSALEACGYNRSEAARRLRVNRVTLLDKIQRYGIRCGARHNTELVASK